MGRPKNDPADNVTRVTAGLYAEELAIVNRWMDNLGYTQSAAIRALIRAGARGPATSPFTRNEGPDHE